MVSTSHNANLVVLGDPETVIAFEAARGACIALRQGYLFHSGSRIKGDVLGILDGGETALQQRAKKYGGLGK